MRIKQIQIPKEAKKVTVEAANRTLGRVATEIAHLLQGKDDPNYVPYKDEDVFVVVENIEKMKVTGKKMDDKLYWHYSGYPGGISSRTMREIWEKDPREVLWRAVYGMLPKNKLRPIRMKRMIIELDK